MADNEALRTVDEVAAMLRVNKPWVYRMANKGGLPSPKVGYFLRFKREEILAWLEKGSEELGPPQERAQLGDGDKPVHRCLRRRVSHWRPRRVRCLARAGAGWTEMTQGRPHLYCNCYEFGVTDIDELVDLINSGHDQRTCLPFLWSPDAPIARADSPALARFHTGSSGRRW